MPKCSTKPSAWERRHKATTRRSKSYSKISTVLTILTMELAFRFQARKKIAPYRAWLKQRTIPPAQRWIAKPRMCCAFCAKAQRLWLATSLFRTTSPHQGTPRLHRTQPARATAAPTAARTVQTAGPRVAPRRAPLGRRQPGTPRKAPLRLAARAVTRAGISAQTACRQTGRLCRARTTRLHSWEGLAPQIQRIRPRILPRFSIHWPPPQPLAAEPR